MLLLSGLASLGLLLANGPARSAPVVYHSAGNTSGLLPYVPALPRDATPIIYLYLDPGSLVSSGPTLCFDADGEESCGFHIEVDVAGDPQFILFTANGDAEWDPTFPGNRFVVNGLTTDSPSVGPRLLGMLQLDTSGAQGGNINVTVVQSVAGDGQIDVGSPTTIAFVPEPGFPLLLASGIGGLAVLNRLRRRRPGDSA